jgi:hypothetical protein
MVLFEKYLNNFVITLLIIFVLRRSIYLVKIKSQDANDLQAICDFALKLQERFYFVCVQAHTCMNSYL